MEADPAYEVYSTPAELVGVLESTQWRSIVYPSELGNDSEDECSYKTPLVLEPISRIANSPRNIVQKIMKE